jgi:hypothetical protein
MKLKFKFLPASQPYYFKDGKFQKGRISQRAYREVFGCGDSGETIIRFTIIEYKIGNDWIEESMLFRDQEDIKSSPKFQEIMTSLGLK